MKVNDNLPLVKSQFMQIIQNSNKEMVVWHSLFGYPKIISKETVKFLNFFATPKTLKTIFREYEIKLKQKSLINDFVSSYFLIPKGFDERALLEKKAKERERSIVTGSLIDYLGLIMSEICNFRCSYCIHFNNLEASDRIKNQEKLMRFETAKTTVNQYLAILQKNKKKVAEVNFGGGEPLLAWPVIEQILNYCKANYRQEFTFRFSINTNASLITTEIARKLNKHSVEIASSLDGLREGNDLVRLTKNRKGTFDAIIKGFENLTLQGWPLEGIAVTINEHNFPYLDEKIIDWAVERNMKEVRIDIDVINMVEISVEDIVLKLMQMRRYAEDHGIDVFGFWSRPVENLNDSTLDTHVAFCGAARGNTMCVNPAGDIYGCGYSAVKLGTLRQFCSFFAPEGSYYRFVRSHLTGMMEMCRGCIIEGQCGGGCNITQEFDRVTKTGKIKRMCDFYRRMTQRLLLEQLQKKDVVI